MDTTVIIPVGPSHLDNHIYARAVQSVEAQTVRVPLLVIEDVEGRGPAWARNQGIAQATTRWVVFLDADDELEPHAIERMERFGWDAAWPNRYVFIDWYTDGVHRQSDTPVCGGQGSRFVVTALHPTHWLRHVGGFDETLQHGGEDTALFFKLAWAGCCGVHLEEPLLHYHAAHNSRAHRWRAHPDYRRVMNGLAEQYGGARMACCGQTGAGDVVQLGEKRDGDILAVATFHGKRKVVGAVTGRVYPRTAYPHQLWMAPEDVARMPHMFRRLEPPPPPPPAPQEPVKVRQRVRHEPGSLGAAVQMAQAHETGRDIVREYTPTAETVRPSRGAIVRMAQDAVKTPSTEDDEKVKALEEGIIWGND
jgi:hypothetical protein